jgi:hypothetical protein
MGQEMMVYVPTMMSEILKKEIKCKGGKTMKMKNSFNKLKLLKLLVNPNVNTLKRNLFWVLPS